MSAETVFISGASGYIALHTIDLLLSQGYPVIGTVRSTSKGEYLEKNFKAKFPQGKFSYVIVEDIGADNAFDEALKQHPEIKYVLHTASPFSFAGNKDIVKAYINPAVNGTLSMLKGIKAHAPQVTNVVITSSYAAIMHLGADKSFLHTEKTWNPITLEQAEGNEILGYIASKTYAEKAAWEFVEREKPAFALTTLNPPYVFGPQYFEDSIANETLNTSAEIINGLLKSSPSDTEFPTANLAVDVRDLAKYHVAPLTNAALAGHRLFPTSGQFSADRYLLYINKNFPELRGKIAKGSEDAAAAREENAGTYDNSETVKLTGLTFTPIEETVVDSVKQILDYKSKQK